MVNFRFHVISLVAVFLALGVGILMGSTVIDQATVKQLRRNVDAIRSQRDKQKAARGQAERTDAQWQRFADEGKDQLLLGRLTDVNVLVVAVRGVDGKLVDDVHEWLRDARAVDQGTLWFRPKLALSSAGDARDLATVLGRADVRPASLRREVFAQLADALVPSPTASPAAVTPTVTAAPAAASPELPGATLLSDLRGAGFVDFDAPRNVEVDLGQVPVAGTRLIVIGGPGARIDAALSTLPLCTALARRIGAAVVAGEATDPDSTRSAPSFVTRLRKDRQVTSRITTVDDLDLFYGRVALVLAVEDLAGGVVGHYGVAPGLRLLPPTNE